MAATTAQLVIEYPELAPLLEENPTYVAAVLARAERRVSPSWTAETRDDQVYLQAAEFLALSPMGRNAKLSVELTSGRFSTSYTDELALRKRAEMVAIGRVV